MTWPQEHHADLGLIEDDHTPNMNKAGDVLRQESDRRPRNPITYQETKSWPSLS